MAGVVVLRRAFDLNDIARASADRFAAEGYLALAPGPRLLKIDPTLPSASPRTCSRTHSTSPQPIKAAHDWLAAARPVQRRMSRSISFCMGGAALLARSPSRLRRTSVN